MEDFRSCVRKLRQRPNTYFLFFHRPPPLTSSPRAHVWPPSVQLWRESVLSLPQTHFPTCASDAVVGSCTCQLDRAVECPDVLSNIILGLPVRMFLGEINMKLVHWGKEAALPNVGGPHPVSRRPEWNKKSDVPPSKRESVWPVGP